MQSSNYFKKEIAKIISSWTVPNLRWFNLEFFNFMVVQKQHAFTVEIMSNFDLFLG